MGIINSTKNLLGIRKGIDYKDINTIAAMGASTYREFGGRGAIILNSSDIRNFTGKLKDGSYKIAPSQMPIYYLNVADRVAFARLCTPVFSVITARMNKISALDWKITPKKKEEDRFAETMKAYRDLYNELKNYNDLQYLSVKAEIVNRIRQEFPDILPDLSNFEGCLKRWKMRLNWSRMDKIDEITDWLLNPYQDEKFSEITKKIVFDLMVHSAAAIYKHVEGGRLEHYSLLPGGSIIKTKTRFASNMPEEAGYIQVTNGYMEPQIMYSDELSYMEYYPITMWNINLIPLEALINKCLEYIDTDKRMRDEADGQKPPKKLIIILQDGPGGNLPRPEGGKAVDNVEMRRLEKKLQKSTKSRAITYMGSKVETVDMGDSDTIGERLARQKDIMSDVGLVYGATPMELNMAGSSDTSGRNTSEAQSDIFFGRGIAPIVRSVEEYFTSDLIKYRFFTDVYKLEAERGMDEEQELKLDLMRLQTGDMTYNEIRERENKAIFPGEQYNLPMGTSLGDLMERGGEFNPMFTKETIK